MSRLPRFPARHNRLGEDLIYHTLVKPAVWGAFDRVWLHIDGPLPDPNAGPVIGYLNHTSWWDGYMLFLLHREVLRRSFVQYLMMDERQLRQFPFFSWAGVFSVDRSSRGAAGRAVAYASDMLRQGGNRLFWIFPQGQLLANDIRPLEIRPGLVRIAHRAQVQHFWPVAVRFEFRNQQRPEAFVRAGPLHTLDLRKPEALLQEDIARRLTCAVDTLRDDVLHNRLATYETLMQGRPGVDRLLGRALQPFLLAFRRVFPPAK